MSGLALRALRRAIKPLVPAWAFEGRRYRAAHGRLPNLLRPTRLTERIALRKLYDRNPLFPLCTDKHAVRRYVADRIGEGHLVPVIAVTAAPEELLDLPSWRMTVMKPNHGSQMVLVHGPEEPSPDARRAGVAQLRDWLAMDYSEVHGEWHYAPISPKVVVERNVAEPGADLVEWKFHCFRRPEGPAAPMLQVIAERSASKRMSFHLEADGAYRLLRSLGEPLPIGAPDLPLLEDARTKSIALAAEFDYVRVDWMVSGGRLWFSELTFTPGAGVSTSLGDDLDRRLGALWPRRGP